MPPDTGASGADASGLTRIQLPGATAEEGWAARHYPKYVLFLLFVVSCFNFIDRQILSILAEDVKADLGLTDQDLGFLYGTTFGIFYALFGLPLGRLADQWHRVRLLSIGLATWSLMTAASGLAKTGGTLALARVGVGVGEAAASPCAYSLLSDWFPARHRATVLAIYSAGVFIGSGLSLFLGGWIVSWWDGQYPGGGPFGLTGWRMAFLALGIPGLLLALWVATLREPARGGLEPADRSPFAAMAQDLFAIIPPFTAIAAARRGIWPLAVNLAIAAAIVAATWCLVSLGEPLAQWAALGCGIYAVLSWIGSLKARSPATHSFIVANPALTLTILCYGLNCFLAYSVTFWTAPYAIREIGLDRATAGLLIGGTAAAAGLLGVFAGGILSDRLAGGDPRGRLLVIIFGALAPAPFVLIAFSSQSLPVLCAAVFLSGSCSSSAVGAVAATTQDLVPPRMRGTAVAALSIGATLVGLALGPYAAGRISTLTGDLGLAMQCLSVSSVLAAITGVFAWRAVPAALERRDRYLLEMENKPVA